MVYECPTLVVLSFLLPVPPLEVNQVCLGGLEIETPIVLGILTVFRHFLKMVP